METSACISPCILLLQECQDAADSFALPDVRDILCRFSGRPASYYSLAGTADYQVRDMSAQMTSQVYHARGLVVLADLILQWSPARCVGQVDTLQYSLCSVQTTMKFNHNGTHIEGLGFKHGEHRVIINVNAHDSLEGELPHLQHWSLTGLPHMSCIYGPAPSQLQAHFRSTAILACICI